MKIDSIPTLVAVDHSFTASQLGSLEDTFLQLWKSTGLGTSRVVEYTSANGPLSPAERVKQLEARVGLQFEVHGAVAGDCVVGRRALAFSPSASVFAWASRSHLEGDFGRLVAVVDALMRSCGSSQALIGPDGRYTASAVSELVCEGMSLQQVVERIACVWGTTPQNATALKQYFQTPSCDRTDQADKYFQTDRSIVALA
jgi:hypothetical protein